MTSSFRGAGWHPELPKPLQVGIVPAQLKKPKMMGKEAEKADMKAELAAQIRAEVEAEMEEKYKVGVNCVEATIRAEVEAKIRAKWVEARMVAAASCGCGGKEVAITGGRSVELSEFGPSLGGGFGG